MLSTLLELCLSRVPYLVPFCGVNMFRVYLCAELKGMASRGILYFCAELEGMASRGIYSSTMGDE